VAEPQPSIRNLLLDPDQGGAVGRLRRAREALLQAGTAPDVIEQIGLESATLALGQALSQAGFVQAAQRCCDLAASYGPGSTSSPSSLAELNRWVYPRSLRRYQLAILNKQPLDVELVGASFELRGCRADPDRNHLLLQRRDNASLWWLSSNECANGYLLSASTLRPADHPAPDPDGFNNQEPVLVRAGNSNFAHFLWNELDPLLRLIDAGQSLAVVQDTDTVLNLAQLDGISRVDPALLSNHQSVRLGGTLVTGKARQTVIDALAREVEGPLPVRRPQPLILLGVRGPGRRELRNEVTFMQALIDAITQHFHRPLILLDGFTYQHNNQQHPLSQEREQACQTRVKQILQHCRAAQLENLCGLGFATWLQRTEGVRFYVSHEGTMQHKLGWLRPEIPGLCLVGSSRAEAIALWHRQQCEGASTLATLPIELYQQDPIEQPHDQEQERNQPFEIRDIARAVALTMHQITTQLELPEQSGTPAADQSE
jgi:hypothetical protein